MKKSYENTIKEVLAEASKNDCWDWTVLSIKENTVSLFWSYLEESKPFTLTIIDKGIKNSRISIWVDIPNSATGCCCFVGNGYWDDAKTVEEGIALVLNEAIRVAREIF